MTKEAGKFKFQSDTRHWDVLFYPSLGILISATAFWLLPVLLIAQTNFDSAEAIPPLRPPRGEIPPTFWEQYGHWMMIGVVLAIVLAGVAVWLLTRSKAGKTVPPHEQARRALEPLCAQPENGALLSKVSQILRHYVTAAFGLPGEELTTSEFCKMIS